MLDQTEGSKGTAERVAVAENMWILRAPKGLAIALFAVAFVLQAGCILVGWFAGPPIWTHVTSSAWNCANATAPAFDPATCTGVDLAVANTTWHGRLSGLGPLSQ